MKNTENSTTTFLRFHKASFFIFLFILGIEILIALFVKDSIIRPYGGDVLVVMLMYCFFKSFVDIKPLYLAIAVTVFAYLVEVGQYFNLVEMLNLQDNRVMSTIIGSSFSWGDMLCYTIGGIICYLIDRKRS
ncbi:DUF2809 domain-containing protein [Dysgonomonas sp. 511]|uniref:ribosomal maturation YjgA family protein n=1 Tax=Dysgonomonas sp. 511 TaxID=2302930 RepID=UPI0013D0A83E|nr:DUF2809 domain-containing protein [Dysgonomonas sp. 511]NDV79587.1 DUF2809 domain-containing protein [Dysgonomonas sp. 511]